MTVLDPRIVVGCRVRGEDESTILIGLVHAVTTDEPRIGITHESLREAKEACERDAVRRARHDGRRRSGVRVSA